MSAQNPTPPTSLLPDLSSWWGPIGLAVTLAISSIGFVLVGGKKLRELEQNTVDVAKLKSESVSVATLGVRVDSNSGRIAGLHEELAAIAEKLDHILTAVTLVGTAQRGHEAEIESLRRDVTRIEENTR